VTNGDPEPHPKQDHRDGDAREGHAVPAEMRLTHHHARQLGHQPGDEQGSLRTAGHLAASWAGRTQTPPTTADRGWKATPLDGGEVEDPLKELVRKKVDE